METIFFTLVFFVFGFWLGNLTSGKIQKTKILYQYVEYCVHFRILEVRHKDFGLFYEHQIKNIWGKWSKHEILTFDQVMDLVTKPTKQ